MPTISWEKYFLSSFFPIFLLALGEKNNFIRFFLPPLHCRCFEWSEGKFLHESDIFMCFYSFLTERNFVKHFLLLLFDKTFIIVVSFHFLVLERGNKFSSISLHATIQGISLWHPQVASFKLVTRLCVERVLLVGFSKELRAWIF